jgi:hypothetical protein
MPLSPPFWKTMLAVAKGRWRSDAFISSALIIALLLWRGFFKN